MLYICPVFKDQRAPQACARDLTRIATCPSSLALPQGPVKGNLAFSSGRQARSPRVSHGDSDEYSTPPAEFGKGGTHFFLKFLQSWLFIESFFQKNSSIQPLLLFYVHIRVRVRVINIKEKRAPFGNPLIIRIVL